MRERMTNIVRSMSVYEYDSECGVRWVMSVMPFLFSIHVGERTVKGHSVIDDDMKTPNQDLSIC